jgi:hypothetical protein
LNTWLIVSVFIGINFASTILNPLSLVSSGHHCLLKEIAFSMITWHNGAWFPLIWEGISTIISLKRKLNI